MKEAIFQPFTDRLSRDIRNDLSESLMEVISTGTLVSARKIADKYLNNNPAHCYQEYIEQRLLSYRKILSTLREGPSDPLFQGLVLWDEQLFFEVHEVLEHAWMKAEGTERLFLQAMIRAAGVYIKLEMGYTDSAERIAKKALPVLEENNDRLASYINPDKLLDALNNLTQNPPKLLK